MDHDAYAPSILHSLAEECSRPEAALRFRLQCWSRDVPFNVRILLRRLLEPRKTMICGYLTLPINISMKLVARDNLILFRLARLQIRRLTVFAYD